MPADTIAGDVEEVRDRALRYSLENGVAFLHKTLSASDQAAVRRLFASGAIQVRCKGVCGRGHGKNIQAALLLCAT